MAKIIETSTGNKAIEISLEESTKCGFGNVCDNCNELLKGTRYYIPVINRLVCKQCYDTTINNLKHYSEDDAYANKYLKHYSKILGIEYKP